MFLCYIIMHVHDLYTFMFSMVLKHGIEISFPFMLIRLFCFVIFFFNILFTIVTASPQIFLLS